MHSERIKSSASNQESNHSKYPYANQFKIPKDLELNRNFELSFPPIPDYFKPLDGQGYLSPDKYQIKLGLDPDLGSIPDLPDSEKFSYLPGCSEFIDETQNRHTGRVSPRKLSYVFTPSKNLDLFKSLEIYLSKKSSPEIEYITNSNAVIPDGKYNIADLIYDECVTPQTLISNLYIPNSNEVNYGIITAFQYWLEFMDKGYNPQQILAKIAQTLNSDQIIYSQKIVQIEERKALFELGSKNFFTGLDISGNEYVLNQAQLCGFGFRQATQMVKEALMVYQDSELKFCNRYQKIQMKTILTDDYKSLIAAMFEIYTSDITNQNAKIIAFNRIARNHLTKAELDQLNVRGKVQYFKVNELLMNLITMLADREYAKIEIFKTPRLKAEFYREVRANAYQYLLDTRPDVATQKTLIFLEPKHYQDYNL